MVNQLFEVFIKKICKKGEGDKSYVKWKGYDSRFNSWIIKKNLEWNFLNFDFVV